MPWIDANGQDPSSGGMGDATTSYMYLKMMGTHGAAGGGGDQMPKNGTPMTPEDLEMIMGWIEFGAPEFGN